MNCQDYEIALGDYVDGTLDERSRIEFETHLASCDRCRAVVADLGVIRARRRWRSSPSCRRHTCGRSCQPHSRRSTHRRSSAGASPGRRLRHQSRRVTLVAGLAWIGNGLAPIKAPVARLASAAPAIRPSAISVESAVRSRRGTVHERHRRTRINHQERAVSARHGHRGRPASEPDVSSTGPSPRAAQRSRPSPTILPRRKACSTRCAASSNCCRTSWHSSTKCAKGIRKAPHA